MGLILDFTHPRLQQLVPPAMIPILHRFQLLDQAQDAYRQRIYQLVQLYEGFHEDDLKQVIKRIYYDPTELDDLLETDNLVKAIVLARAQVFKGSVKFTLKRNGVELDPEQPADQAQLDKLEFDIKRGLWRPRLQDINRYTELAGTTLVKWTCRRGALVPYLLTPDMIEVEQDPDFTEEALQVLYQSGTPQSSPALGPRTRKEGIYHLWTATEYQRLDGVGNLLPNPGNPSNQNPYGRLPFTVFRSVMPKRGAFFHDPGESLINGNRSVNVALAELNAAVKRQAFSQPVITGELAKGYKLEVGRSKPIQLDLGAGTKQPDFKYVSPDSHIDEILRVIESKVARISARYGISPSAIRMDGNAQSGYALRILNQPLLEYRQEQVPIYLETLTEAWPTMRAVANLHAVEHPDPKLKNVRYADDVELHVELEEPTFELAPTERIALEAHELDTLQDNVVDMLMRKHGLTEEQAIERWERNKQFAAPAPDPGGLLPTF